MIKVISPHNDDFICPAHEDCLFYNKDTRAYSQMERWFYEDNCLRSGTNCGLYKNWEQTRGNPKYKDLEEKIKKKK
jgi:hypothetical protein